MTKIIVQEQAGELEILAAKQIRKYVYLRTGDLIKISQGHIDSAKYNYIELIIDQKLNEQSYKLKTERVNLAKKLKITGGTPIALLYGAYEFCEFLGVRFYLHGDVIPDEQINFQIPEINLMRKPLFKLRGSQPFHDFQTGPDWWSENDYKMIFEQMVKIRMNFIGLHTYPEGRFGPEPTVWLGLTEDVNPDGTVSYAYPSTYQNTYSKKWGTTPVKTSDFSFGADQIFKTDLFGPEYLLDLLPWPTTMKENNDVFNTTGKFLKNVFDFARNLKIKTCVGTEATMKIPQLLQKRLNDANMDLDSEETLKKIYKGIFYRITKTYPIDYYWIWTPEGWNNRKSRSLEQTPIAKKSFKAALDAINELNHPFKLATCGWVLGPYGDRLLMDRILPPTVPLSSITRNQGHDPVPAYYGDVKEHSTWVIPWMEDDGNMVSPQLWVGRVRKDAMDALKYGCSGIFGIHWKISDIAPNFAALAYASWEQQKWISHTEMLSVTEKVLYEKWLDFDKVYRDYEALNDSLRARRDVYIPSRYVDTSDFYLDWATANFGNDVASEVADVFVKIDCRLPRPSRWAKVGPGSIRTNYSSISEIEKKYYFVDTLQAIRSKIHTAGNLARFDFWVNAFEYMKSMAMAGYYLNQLSMITDQIKAERDESERKRLGREHALPLRLKAAEYWRKFVTHQLQKTVTVGDMGLIACIEQNGLHNVNQLTEHDPFLEELSGEALPDQAKLTKDYVGQKRIIVPTVRGILQEGEDFSLDVILLGIEKKSAKFYYRAIGESKFHAIDLVHKKRSVYAISIPSSEIKNDFEYYIQVISIDGSEDFFPAMAPDINNLIVIFNQSLN